MKVTVRRSREVFPASFKLGNQYENDIDALSFDLSELSGIEGNKYLICRKDNYSDFKSPLVLDEKDSIPIAVFLTAQAGRYSCVLVVTETTIDDDYNFSEDNPRFVSDVFSMYVEENFLSGTSTGWQLPPTMHIEYEEMVALKDKLQAELESGAFNGKSAYEIAVEHGYQGTEEEWIENLGGGSLDLMTVEEFEELWNANFNG